MKSSTIRRSNLSKEKIAVLEALSKFKSKNSISSSSLNSSNSGSINVELDLLWQNFRMPKVERSPIVYLGMGFAAGVVATILVSALIGVSTTDFHPNFKFNIKMPSIAMPTPQKANKLNFLPSSGSASQEAAPEQKPDEEYTVQSGDTMEAIARRFYGTYSPEKVELIMKANNMTNPNKLSIGQKLIIPMNDTSEAIPTDESATEEQ